MVGDCPVQQHEDHRVAFDFEVEFSNGGGIKGWDFRLDIDGTDISDEALGDHIVRDLRLLMVGSVRILGKRVFRERHKRPAEAGPPGPSAPDASRRDRRLVDLSRAGTAIDAPYHGFPATADVAALPLASIADLEGRVVRLDGMAGRAVSRRALLPATQDVAGKAVLIATGWSAAWGTPGYFTGHSHLTQGAAEHLRDSGAALVGIDSPSVDDTDDPARPVHAILLRAGIPIVQNLTNIGALPTGGFRFSAVPVRAEGAGALPVRAWARL